MDILKRLNTSSRNVVIDPGDIFMTLPSKEKGYGYPRYVQGEVWKKWFEVRDKKNIIIKMNTGSGKTVVGLLILQSSLNEGKGPAIYAVPDKYLVKQVINEATRLGIKATDNMDDYFYRNMKSILVTTIHKIVNGYSSFGMRTSGPQSIIGSIVIDDVHACMEKIDEQYRVRIKADQKAYSEIIDIFSSSLREYDIRSYIRVVEQKDGRERILVPFWEWQKHQEEVYRVLSRYNNIDHSNIYYSLPLVEDSLDTSDCLITASEIEIAPKGIDIGKITSFEEAQRRVFMSATLADDGVFVSSLGLMPETIDAVITPENANDIGDRLILFPKHVNSSITDDEIKTQVLSIAEKYNVSVLVPSFERARFWDQDLKCTANKETIDQVVASLKSEKRHGLTVFVNRYDGIDLPGDACRLLVIDGLPPLNSVRDRYIQSIAPQSTILLRNQIQRIEQGMGRGVRSTDDECCIVLMGADLSDVLSRIKGVEYFSSATRCQYELSKQLWDLLVEGETRPSVECIFELAEYSLQRNSEWVSKCKEALSEVKYSTEINVEGKVVALRGAFELSLKKQWKSAAGVVKTTKNAETDNRTKAYLCQIEAEYTNQYDKSLAQQILKYGKNLSGTILSPIDGVEYDKKTNSLSQAKSIKKALADGSFSSNDLLLYIDSVLSNLSFGVDYSKFEESINIVGGLLGFISSRPDNENSGYGPDNLWIMEDEAYLIIECKNGAQTEFISKAYCSQLSASINWLNENYTSSQKVYPAMIFPSYYVDTKASPDPGMIVMTEVEMQDFKNSVRGFFNALCTVGDFEDVDRIGELLKTYKLRSKDIPHEYFKPFKRR